ncbi:TetR/AcrR family transcriptional regulator [Desulfosarcina sp.]|uniref:TetR/AcrR family transcriptional regulator n=1 Tax=Desulfosarcina sp. TaxID=2027861 RepID=UPI0029AEC26B|nr:TetR/AcrR family transcriptional regulator [Desulfosarcina sp.]MDX2452876.1 TetR/AcrR family transcriptional regulator [Desulfosarcina sp.]MDX2490620.1 TetR/AcrR family transcriptional regulator [Desulfosarcina sp.]
MSTFQKLRKEERETRKNLIVNAAMDLFSQKDFHKIGMRDIAKRAGISAAAIYRYFPSRDDVFVEALVCHMKVVEELFEKKVKAGQTSLEELAMGSVDYLLENESVFQMMGHFMITGQIQQKALDRYNTMQRNFLNILEKVNNQTDIGMNNRLVTHAIYASVTGVVMSFKNYPGRSPEEIKRHIHRLVRIISSVFSTGNIPESLREMPGQDITKLHSG